MSDDQIKLFNRLWAIANILRGKMDASEFKNYMLGFIFYKFLSEKLEYFLNKTLKEDGIDFAKAFNDSKYAEALKEEAVEHLGFFLEPQYLFRSLVAKAQKKEFILDELNKTLKSIEQSTLGHESEDDFVGLFDDVDLQSSKLGKSEKDKNEVISEILKQLAQIDFELHNSNMDILGDAYEYLIGEFASNAGKKAGEFYTPQQVSKILAKIVTLGKDKIKSAYDPTTGSASLLIRISKESVVSHFSGQELNQTTYNLARMNMILHGVKFSDFDIVQGDTLTNPQHTGIKFEAVVANPPFSANWPASDLFLNDERFSAYGRLAPASKADYAFVQHMIYQLDENGTMAVVLPHGVLFRGGSEGEIRKFLIEDRNYLDAVIGLPSNIFYGTPIATVILIFKKCRVNSDNIIFIDGSTYFEKKKTQNYLRDEDVERIMDAYKNRQNIEKFAYVAPMAKIKENEYNLNIPRYVDTFEQEESIDIDSIVDELKAIEPEIKAVDADILKYCNELGIKAPLL